MFKSLKRSISAISASAMVLGLLAFVPTTMAANDLSWNPAPAAEYVTGGNPYPINVGMSNFTQATKVDIIVAKKNDFQLNVVDSYTYLGNTSHKFEWDGTLNGAEASAGNYSVNVMVGNQVALTKDFQVINGPKTAFNPAPVAQYTVGTGNYKVSVALTNYIKDTDVKFSVYKKGAQLPQPVLQTLTYKANGTQEFTWDGKINGSDPTPGTYVLSFTGVDKDGNPTNPNPLTKEIEVKNQIIVLPKGTLTFVSSPSEYVDGSGTYKVSVKITDFTSPTLVDLSIENPDNNLFIPKDNFTFTSNNETHEFTLTDSDISGFGYDVGDVVKFELSGTDQVNVDTNTISDTFKIVAADDGSCAGYKDMDEGDKGCEAVEWAKNEGIMTGNDNGTFGPNDLFQRDQSAKVALEAFNLYNKNSNYCNGKDPFPDVDKDDWSGNYVCRAVSTGTVTGYLSGVDAGLFKPARNVNLVEMFALMLRNVDGPMPKGPSFNNNFSSTDWYAAYAKYAFDNSLYPDTNGLLPTHAVTRLELAMFLYELHQKGEI